MAQQGREVVIVEAVRTPIGRGHREKGYYKDTHPADLLGRSYTELIARTGIDPNEVEDVIAGCVQQFGEQAFNVARNAWLQEGLPIEAAATTVDRQCGSAQQAVNFGAALIASGVHDVVIGSGVEHMGHIPFTAGMKTQQEFGAAFTPKLMDKHNIVGQGLGAEMIADQWEISRAELDELAVRSHRLAHEATEEGRFEREMIPMEIDGRTIITDQGIRPDTSLETLSQLKPGVQGGRQDHRRQLIADLRRRRRGPADDAREGPAARADPARADRRPDDRRLRPGEDARGPDPGDPQDPGAQRHVDRATSTSSRSTRPSRRSSPRGRASTTPTWTG